MKKLIEEYNDIILSAVAAVIFFSLCYVMLEAVYNLCEYNMKFLLNG